MALAFRTFGFFSDTASHVLIAEANALAGPMRKNNGN
jgi:hypothetical protein